MCPHKGCVRKGVIGLTASERLINHLRLGPKTAVAVHDPSNMFYLTEGYTGEGLVYISEASRVIVTDFPLQTSAIQNRRKDRHRTSGWK